MSKHTPGPWKADILAPKDLGAIGIRLTDGLVVAVARFSDNPRISSQDAFANATLIAAAPDLLDACKQALGAFENGDAIDWSDLQKAIDKAEGK